MPTENRLTVPLGFHRTPSSEGPKRLPGLRRRFPQSKNCANAKKDKKNALRRRRKHEVEAAELKDQICYLHEQLMLKRARGLAAGQNAEGVAFNIVRGYFDLLCRGFDPVRHPQQTQELERYLQATFAIDVKSPDFTGRDVFVKQLKLFAECHTSFECTATSMNVFSRIGHPDVEEETAGHDDSNKNVYVVQTYGTTTLQISRTTIEQIFPHILTDEPLVQSLIGKKYSLPFTMFTYVDVNNGCVFQVETKVDLTSALLDLLQDPVATIKMVQETAMTKHGNLLLTDDVQEDQNDVGNCLF